MLPFDELLKEADNDLGKGTHKKFLESLSVIGHQDHYKKPLLKLNNKSDKYISCSDAAQIEWPNIQAISFVNNSNVEEELILQVKAPPASLNIDEVFQYISEITSHSNWIADFRQVINYSAYIYSQPNYLLFHGDGNCLLLSILFNCVVEHILQKNIEIKFCRKSDGTFSHVYCFDEESKLIYDIDQKSILDSKKLHNKSNDIQQPYGLVYWLAMYGGALKFGDILPAQKSEIFSSYTAKYFIDNFYNRKDNEKARIYKQNPDQDEFFGLWQELHSAIRNRDNGKAAIMGNAFEPFSILVPPRGSINIGFSKKLNAIQEIVDLGHIFHGRCPMEIIIPINNTSRQNILLHDIPWLMLFSLEQESVELNGVMFDTRLSLCGNYRYLGMRSFEKIGLFETKCWPFNIDVVLDTGTDDNFSLIYPVNAFVFNSDYIEASFNGEISCAMKKQV